MYRALDKLIERGLVHRIESLNAFVVCAHSHDDNQGLVAFAICDRCGQVTEFADGTIDRRLGKWSRAHVFRPGKITVEMRGVCGRCLGT